MLLNYKLLNEKGTALLVALIMLLLLTLIGLAAITTSNIEVQISGNQRLSNTAIYSAEAAIESIRLEVNSYTMPETGYPFQINITPANGTSANPSYSTFSGLSGYPYEGDANRGDLWNDYNIGQKLRIKGRTNSNPDKPGSMMYVFLVRGSAGLAGKRIEVGIVTPENVADGSNDTGGTGYPGGSS